MKNKYIIALVALVAVSAASCTDFLDRSSAIQVTSESLFENESSANAALMGVYDGITTGNFCGRNTMIRQDIKGPDYMLYNNGGGQYLTVEYSYRESASTYGEAGEIWLPGFRAIKDANNFIANAEKLEQTALVKDMIAQAKACKAYAYLELTKTFCYPPAFAKSDSKFDLGLPLMKTRDDNIEAIVNPPRRATLIETMNYVKELLTEALADIDNSRKDVGFWTTYGIKGMLARVCLYQEDWTNALKYAEEAAAGGSCIPYNQYVEKVNQKNQSESLFEMQFNINDHNSDRMPGYVFNQTMGANGRRSGTESKGYGDGGVSDTFLALLDENPKDVRHGLLHEDKSSTCPADVPLSECKQGVNGYSARFYYKFIGGLEGSPFVHNIPAVRVPEMYLIAAEACSELGGRDAEALNWLNKVYEARTTDKLSGLSGAALKTAIFNERRRELIMEGFCIWDFLRKGRSFTRDASHPAYVSIDPVNGRNDKDFHKVVAPIPITEMDANPNMRDQQNYGYEAYHN